MFTGRAASLCWSLLSGCILVSSDQKNIPAEFGQDVTLTCRAPNNNIIVVEWSRADLRRKDVLVYRDGEFLPDEQHPSFKNRVDLQDRQMKDGDVSVILKDVTINDAGTYECRIKEKGTSRVVIPSEPISIITLRVVVPPGQVGRSNAGEKEDGPAGLTVGLSVCAGLLVVAAVGLLIYRKHKEQQSETSEMKPV